jgi:hypothetical protein
MPPDIAAAAAYRLPEGTSLTMNDDALITIWSTTGAARVPYFFRT